jgi:hypothetical protein
MGVGIGVGPGGGVGVGFAADAMLMPPKARSAIRKPVNSVRTNCLGMLFSFYAINEVRCLVRGNMVDMLTRDLLGVRL